MTICFHIIYYYFFYYNHKIIYYVVFHGKHLPIPDLTPVPNFFILSGKLLFLLY